MIHNNRLKSLDARRPSLSVSSGFTMSFGCYRLDCLFSQFFFFIFFSKFRSKNFKILRPQKRRFITKHVNLALFGSFSRV